MSPGSRQPVTYCQGNGKVRFSKREAETARNRRMEEDHAELRIYQCPYCNDWHLTSNVNKRKWRIKR